MLIISSASCWLLTYIIAHIDLIVLRNKYPKHQRPFKSPMFPLLQVMGIAGMAYAFFNNAPTPELRLKVYINTALFIGIIAVFAFFWLKYIVKKPLFEREPIEQAIKD
jgi:amino acid transporter